MTNETIELINSFLQSQLDAKSMIDIFIEYVSPIIQLLVIIGGAALGLYKYYKTKNIEVYEKLLSEVYAPLYQYLVKQELFRKIMMPDLAYKETPILEFINVKTSSNETIKEAVLGLSRTELLKVLDSINIGLAPKELYTLLSMYKVLVYIESISSNKSDNILSVSIMKVDVENKLRKEIISGYKKYHKKLGVNAGADNDFFSLSDDQINFEISVPKEKIQKLKEDIEKNPDKY